MEAGHLNHLILKEMLLQLLKYKQKFNEHFVCKCVMYIKSFTNNIADLTAYVKCLKGDDWCLGKFYFPAFRPFNCLHE